LPSSLPEYINGLLKYLAKPDEKANEDLALAYFRKLYGDDFHRQHDAHGADGYVAGSFLLELKGKTNDWLSGLFQALAYQNCGATLVRLSLPRRISWLSGEWMKSMKIYAMRL